MVHGQHSGSLADDYQVVKDGLEVTLAALRKIVFEAKIPDNQTLELGPADDTTRVVLDKDDLAHGDYEGDGAGSANSLGAVEEK